MIIKYKFFEPNSVVFSAGKNHGNKIYADNYAAGKFEPGNTTGVELFYDSELPHIFIQMKYKGQITHIPTYHTADPFSAEELQKIENHKKPKAGGNIPKETPLPKKGLSSKPAQVAQASQGE